MTCIVLFPQVDPCCWQLVWCALPRAPLAAAPEPCSARKLPTSPPCPRPRFAASPFMPCVSLPRAATWTRTATCIAADTVQRCRCAAGAVRPGRQRGCAADSRRALPGPGGPGRHDPGQVLGMPPQHARRTTPPWREARDVMLPVQYRLAAHEAIQCASMVCARMHMSTKCTHATNPQSILHLSLFLVWCKCVLVCVKGRVCTHMDTRKELAIEQNRKRCLELVELLVLPALVVVFFTDPEMPEMPGCHDRHTRGLRERCRCADRLGTQSTITGIQ